MKLKKNRTNKAVKDNSQKARKIEYLFDSHVAHKFRDNFIDKLRARSHKIRENAVINGKNGVDSSGILESTMLDNKYIFTRVLDVIETDDIRLDLMMAVSADGRRGIPRGKVIELSGREECMKSARALQWIASAQRDPRGCIVLYMDTESKLHPDYASLNGVDLSRVSVEFPAYVEAAYWSMEDILSGYIKNRDAAIYNYIKKKNKKGNLSATELDYLIYRGRLSYPTIIIVYDSVGNHQSMLAWQKDQKTGKKTKTPGAHAAAHADGFRSIKNIIGYSMATIILINHTKEDMGGAGKWGVKKTKTYGGGGVLYNSDFRLEQKPGFGDANSGFLKHKKGDAEIIDGKWLTVKLLKNSMAPTSNMKIEKELFRYAVGFDMGASYLLALDEMKLVKGGASLKVGKKNTVKLPWGGEISVTFKELHKMLATDDAFKIRLRKAIVDNANANSIFMKNDV